VGSAGDIFGRPVLVQLTGSRRVIRGERIMDTQATIR
jgi:hypothetical protein